MLLTNGTVQDFMKSQTAWIRGDMFVHEPDQGFMGFHLPAEWQKVKDGVYKDTSNRRAPMVCRARRLEDAYNKAIANPCRLWGIRHQDLPAQDKRPPPPENVHSIVIGEMTWFMYVPVLAGNGADDLDPDLPPPPPRDSGWCLIDAVQDATGRSRQEIWRHLLQNCPDIEPPLPDVNMSPKQLTHSHLRKMARPMEICFRVHGRNNKFIVGDERLPCFDIYHSTNHWSGTKPPPAPIPSPSSGGDPGSGDGSSQNRNKAARPRSELAERLWLSCRSWGLTYRPSKKRAKVALRAIRDFQFGELLRKDPEWLAKAKSVVDCPPRASMRPIRIAGILGEGGTGKSYDMLESE